MSTTPPVPAGTAVAEARPGRHQRLLDELGTAICSGGLAPGSVLFIDDIADQRSVSRSVVREVLRVLSSMGLIGTRRRVGTVIRPPSEWNMFDPQIIRWRLASTDRVAQLRSLTELRGAVEPKAASLAAERCTPEQASNLVRLAAAMWAAGKAGDEAEFLRLDVEFHRQVLLASGNDMFAKLHDLVAEVLVGRHRYDLDPDYASEQTLRMHADVAQAVQRHNGEAAQHAMFQIMLLAIRDMRAVELEHATEAVRATADGSTARVPAARYQADR